MKLNKDSFALTPSISDALTLIGYCREGSKRGGECECLLIKGEAGSGKTALIEQYLLSHPREELDHKTKIPVFSTSIPEKVTITKLAQHMLKDLGAPFHSSSRNQIELFDRLSYLLKATEVELIIIDDFHRIAEQLKTKVKVNYDVADWLKMLISSTNIPVVSFGLPELSQEILNVNCQLNRRFMAKTTLAPLTEK